MGDDTQSELYMTTDQYADFLIKIFNLYVKDFTRGNYISIRQFDNWVRNPSSAVCAVTVRISL